MNEKGEWKGLISLSGDGRVASHQASPRVQYVCSIHYSAPSADRSPNNGDDLCKMDV